MKAESCQEGRVTHYPSDWSPPTKTQNQTQTNTHIQLAAATRNFCKRFSILIHCPLFLLLLTFSTLSSPPLPVCLSSAIRILSGLMKYITGVLLSLNGKCLLYKMNWLSLAHPNGQCVENVWTEKMGWGGDRRGVKYYNYHVIDFHWCDQENKCYSVNVDSTWWESSKKKQERGESDIFW